MSLLKYPGQYLDKIIPITEKRGSGGSSFSLPINIFDTRYGITDITYSESNARGTWTSGTNQAILSVPKSTSSIAKWVLEFDLVTANSALGIGIMDLNALPAATTVPETTLATAWAYISNGNKTTNNVVEAYGATYAAGDKISILLDATAATCVLAFAVNGTSQGTAYSGITGDFIPYVSCRGVTNLSIRVSTTLTYPFAGYTQWR